MDEFVYVKCEVFYYGKGDTDSLKHLKKCAEGAR